MIPPLDNTLSKTERLSGRMAVQRLMAHGRWGSTAHLRFCWTAVQPAASAAAGEAHRGADNKGRAPLGTSPAATSVPAAAECTVLPEKSAVALGGGNSGREAEEGTAPGLRPNRILVSVPKKLFKRAVKRNLLKRRMREAYRTQKGLLSSQGVHFMVVYNSPDLLSSAEIRSEMAQILSQISAHTEQTA